MSESTNLIAFANTNQPDRLADIIFIHGLGGDALDTWRHPDNKEDENNFWLTWLAKDFPQMGIRGTFSTFGQPNNHPGLCGEGRRCGPNSIPQQETQESGAYQLVG